MNSEILELEKKEFVKRDIELDFIASQNLCSEDILDACSSISQMKYAEGFPGKRYYAGCEVVDKIEKIANERARKLFNCKWSNVQPNSGSQANQAVYLALCKPGDTILGMGLDAGGHLTHGSKVSSSGKLYNAISYGLDENGYINYDEIYKKLVSENPRLLIVGGSAYPRMIDFERIRKIVNCHNSLLKCAISVVNDDEEEQLKKYEERKCYLMVDMAHIAGLVAAGVHPSPLPYADVVTSTVQKTLRSGRGGLILSNNEELGKKIDKAVFPGIQGGPLMNMIAGKAIGFGEALEPSFKEYQEQVLKNIQAMVEVFKDCGVKMITGGSSVHLILLDLKDECFSGKDLETVLEKQGIITNKNAVQNDPKPKTETSGLRLGTACITTRGATEDDAHEIALLICANIDYMRNHNGRIPDAMYEYGKKWVKEWCEKHPIYKD